MQYPKSLHSGRKEKKMKEISKLKKMTCIDCGSCDQSKSYFNTQHMFFLLLTSWFWMGLLSIIIRIWINILFFCVRPFHLVQENPSSFMSFCFLCSFAFPLFIILIFMKKMLFFQGCSCCKGRRLYVKNDRCLLTSDT